MVKNNTKYKNQIIELLAANSPETNWKEYRNYYYRLIQFQQHERLIHLLVMLAVALCTLITCIATIISQFWGLYIVDLLLVILLIPYLFHYRKLENEVQSLYGPFEDLSKKVIEKKNSAS